MKRHDVRLSRATGAMVFALLLLINSNPLQAAGRALLSNHVPAGLHELPALRDLEQTKRLKLAVSLPLRNQAGLSNLLHQIYDPSSPSFHQYLTPAQFTESFGPAEADYQTIRAYALNHKLAIVGTHGNRTLLDLEGNVSDIEAAFHTKLRVYRHPLENREFYAPATEPSADLDIPLLHITGLDNYNLPHPFIKRKASIGSEGRTNSFAGSGPSGTYLGYDFRDAYLPNVTLTGAGQKVALVEFDSGFVQSDITAYEALGGLPNVPVSAVLLDGYDGSQGTDNGEVSLDIEMAIAMAPGLSGVIVYEGETGDDVLNRIATDNSARQISASWGGYADAASDQIFQQYAAQGQSFFNSSGDGDAWVGTIYPPCDDPYVTVVGGTTLFTTGPLGSRTSEQVWNWGYNPPGSIPGDQYVGSSGGISTVWTIPYYQQGISMTNNGGSTTMRNTPDVALTADNIWITDNDGGGENVGGTSASSPLWAAFTALVNQQATSYGRASQGFINPTIYNIAKGSTYSSTFNDIVVGNNTWTNSPTNFYAEPGYDLTTGFGSPTPNLLNALAPVPLEPVLTVLTNFISGGNGNGVIDVNECNNLTVILTNGSTLAATSVEATLISTTPGAIIGQGTSAYSTLYPGTSSANITPFTISTESSFLCGTPINLILILKSSQTTQTNYIQLSTGVTGSPDSFTNANALIIPNANYVPVDSPVVVSGLESAAKFTVSLYLAAEYDEGISISLISPGGTNIILAQNDGGFSANFGVNCSSGGQTTFDDAATTSISSGTAPFLGTFAPVTPLGTLGLLSGTNLNGVWNLQVSDEFPGDSAVLECWTLNVSPEVCIDGGGQCPGSDLSLTMALASAQVFQNSNAIFNLTVSNAGPSSAPNVVIQQSLPPGFTFVGTSNNVGSVTQVGSNLSIILGTLAVNATDTVSVITTAATNGFFTSTASVSAQDTDPNPNNNTASVSVDVTEPTADLAVSIKASPSAVLQGSLLTYTIQVTNNGPYTANGVSLTTTLPANANFISATTSQGSISFNGTYATLGNVPQGDNITVTIVVSPTVTGNATASTTVALSSNQLDPITYNNTASATATVGPAADLSVAATVSPNPVVAGSQVKYTGVISNGGPSTATSITFSQTIPTGATFVSTSLAGGAVSNGTITAAIASLPSGSNILFTNVVTAPVLVNGARSLLLISTLSIFGQPGDPNTNNNVLTLQSIAEPPTITVVAAGALVTSGSSNGSIGTNGTYSVTLFLQNVGTIPTTNLVATLLNTNGVTLASGAQYYGALQPGAAPTGEQFSFTAKGTNGGSIIATLQLQDGSTNLGTNSFTFVLPVLQRFWNTNFISIPKTNFIPEPASGPAGPYPAAITVSGVSGDVGTVTVTVSNMVHTYPNDVGMLLVGPTGISCVLMSSAGQYSTMTNPVTITFDSTASVVLPAYGQIVSATYQPADYYAAQFGRVETFSNSTVPLGPYNTNLAIFDSIPANGNWSLYVYDNANGDYGAISNGWGITFTTITPVNQVADLAATMTALTNQVILGGNITNIWAITNNGPDAVTNVFVTNTLSAGLSLVTNIAVGGGASIQTSSSNIYNLGVIAAGSGVMITNVVVSTISGYQTNSITVGSSVQDGNPGNNTASVITYVIPPPADLAAGGILAVPGTVVLNSNVVFTLYVTNNGPSNAFNVIGVFSNLSNLRPISVVASQGNSSTNASIIQVNFGTLAPGLFADAIVTATAIATNSVTNTWVVSTTSTDTNSSNNMSSVQLLVSLPLPIITNGGAALVTQGAGLANGSINSGQTNTVSLGLLNIGSASTTNLTATLVANGGVQPVSASANYGAIATGQVVSRNFTFATTGAAGGSVTVELILQDGANTNLGPVFYTLVFPSTQSFTNSGAIVIPDIGPASPYPAIIPVAGLTNGTNNLLISRVTATLNGFTHSFPHDVEALLVSPAGQEVVLMEHAGGPYSVSNLVLTYDDTATKNLASNALLLSGTYLASAYTPFDTFPGLTGSPSSTNLSGFDGGNPNGNWLLYVYDDSAGNSGVITGGWSLGLTAVSSISPAALLTLNTIEAPNPAVGGDYINYQITVNNGGPATATGVVLTDTLPTGAVLSSAPATVSQGSFSIGGGAVVASFGAISNGASATLTVQMLAGARGTITNLAVVTSATADLYAAGTTNITVITVGGSAAPYLSASTLPSGLLQLTVAGYAGQSYAIQTSTNLITWSTISTNSGTFSFTASSTNAVQQFYRVLQLPQ